MLVRGGCLSGVSSPSKADIVSLAKKLYPLSTVLVGSRNRFERDLHQQIICFTIKF